MKKFTQIWFYLVLTLFICGFVFNSQSFAGQIYGKVKWQSGKAASNQDLTVRFKHHDIKYVKSDSNGNISVSWSSGHDTIKIFWKGDLVYKGFVKDGESITVYLNY